MNGLCPTPAACPAAAGLCFRSREGVCAVRISTRYHAVLHLATIGFALAFPRLLGACDRSTKVATTLAPGKLGYSLLTRQNSGSSRPS